MHNLIKNERLKLYKRVSTWILTGLVIGLAALVLLTMSVPMRYMRSLESDEQPDWRDACIKQIASLDQCIKNEPDSKAYYENEKKEYQYLLTNNIDPEHWKYWLVVRYFDDLETIDSTDESNNLDIPTAKADLEIVQKLLEAPDWKTYVRMEIDNIKNGTTHFNTPEEKQVQIDIWNMHLDLDIQPMPLPANYESVYDDGYYLGDMHLTIPWQQRELYQLQKNQLSLLRNEVQTAYGTGEQLTTSDKARLQEKINLSTERLKADAPPIKSASLYGLMESSLSMMDLITIILIVLASGIIANEFSNGTIKLLLITPHKRRSVFWAKAYILLEITLITTGALFVTSFLIGGAVWGFGDIGAMYIAPLFGSIVRLPYFVMMLYKYLLMLLPVLAFGTLALMLSAVIRKSAAAISITLALMLGGSMVSSVMNALSDIITIPGAKFLLSSNTNLNVYFQSPSSSFGNIFTGMNEYGTINLVDHSMTLIFSIVVLLVYIFCFMWTARDSFCRRDVK